MSKQFNLQYCTQLSLPLSWYLQAFHHHGEPHKNNISFAAPNKKQMQNSISLLQPSTTVVLIAAVAVAVAVVVAVVVAVAVAAAASATSSPSSSPEAVEAALECHQQRIAILINISAKRNCRRCCCRSR